jgi:CRP-like cAMP-binding protein
MIGEMSLITSAPRSASAVATEMTRAYKIRKKVFLDMLRSDSLPAYKVCYAIARVLAHRLDEIDKTVAMLQEIHQESEALKEMRALQAKLASENPLLDDEEGELY